MPGRGRVLASRDAQVSAWPSRPSAGICYLLFAILSKQLVRIDVYAHLNLVRKRKTIHHLADRSREAEDGSGTQQDLEPIKPFYPFDLGGDHRVECHR